MACGHKRAFPANTLPLSRSPLGVLELRPSEKNPRVKVGPSVNTSQKLFPWSQKQGFGAFLATLRLGSKFLASWLWHWDVGKTVKTLAPEKPGFGLYFQTSGRKTRPWHVKVSPLCFPKAPARSGSFHGFLGPKRPPAVSCCLQIAVSWLSGLMIRRDAGVSRENFLPPGVSASQRGRDSTTHHSGSAERSGCNGTRQRDRQGGGGTTAERQPWAVEAEAAG
jgi:hypothetical protein